MIHIKFCQGICCMSLSECMLQGLCQIYFFSDTFSCMGMLSVKIVYCCLTEVFAMKTSQRKQYSLTLQVVLFLALVNPTVFLFVFCFQPIKRKKEGEEKRMTQEEMLSEAAQTGLSIKLLCEIICLRH